MLDYLYITTMSSHDGVPVLKSFEEASTAMDFDGGEINPTSQYVQLSSSPPSNKSEDKSARRTWNSWTGKYYAIIDTVMV